MKEVEIQTDILKTLRKLRIGFFWRNNNVGVYDAERGIYRKGPAELTLRGVSDILGCHMSKFTAIEVKTPEGFRTAQNLWSKIGKAGDIYLYRPSKSEQHFYNQILFISEVNRNGGLGFFTYSVNHTLKKLGVENGCIAYDVSRNQRTKPSGMESEEDHRQGIFGFG